MHPVFIAALYTLAKKWKRPKCLSTVMDKEEVVPIYKKYYSAIKRNEITSCAAAWTDLESVIVNTVSQIEKENYCMILLICGI